MPQKYDSDEYIDEARASELLGVSRQTLCRWRGIGEAPKHAKYPHGAVRYRVQDVIDWREQFVVAPADVQSEGAA